MRVNNFIEFQNENIFGLGINLQLICAESTWQIKIILLCYIKDSEMCIKTFLSWCNGEKNKPPLPS